ncbi:MAG: CPBP family intramembrane metalloprotease [Planctomycetes bacterium]|nr:CPBP family intramembrane metalloprotease [Planctomycetota bacterium]
MVRVVDDLKSALILSGGFALAASAVVPGLLQTLPPEARSLPLPLPAFCAVLSVQLLAVYGLLGLAGLRLARGRGREPAPQLTALWAPHAACPGWSRVPFAFALGLGCGLLLVAAVATVQRTFPETLPQMLHPSGFTTALLASVAGSFGEEILFRLFVLSLVLRLLPAGGSATVAAVILSAIAFGAAHAPAFIFLFGGWRDVPAVSWLWLMALNGLCGVTYGVVFLRYGIVSAVIAHLGTDVVWHAASQLVRV